ncbi:CHAP domain-containing protein [Pseudosulfitobacter koreensis]|uniref:CHAP domain-containing protein n=1 Tax=Pseudosulfitobacter koreensis TaxID=2968472 RepID=A0ABT1Z3X0_9RHOB|nr:CHAP domain-containing protein [Pseudosulfitobacter koreense]MCR8827815.1 CHAP domain-containing protein [Pseudosulfitobacter koreense]
MYKSMVRGYSGLVLGLGMLVSGCAQQPAETGNFIDEGRMQFALHEVAAKHQSGTRVWCVPFARDLSGIEIYGNANQWWEKAKGAYHRSQAPATGSVLAFKSTSKNPMGHVAVVSGVLSERVIQLDHANWTKNRVSTKMVAMDVSPKNDWSAVRLESAPGNLGATYPTHGFIYPVQHLAAN